MVFKPASLIIRKNIFIPTHPVRIFYGQIATWPPNFTEICLKYILLMLKETKITDITN